MKYNLFFKEATKFSVVRYSAMQNRFGIYHFYNILKKNLTQVGIENRPDLVRNCDEPGLNLGSVRSYPKGDEI